MFRVMPMWTGLISTLLHLAGSKHCLYLPFALGSSKKLLHHSGILSMPSETIICCLCSVSISSFRGSCNAYATLLETNWYGWQLSLAWKLNISSKQSMSEKNIAEFIVNLFVNTSFFCLLLCLCYTWNNLVCLFYYHVYLLYLSLWGLCLFYNFSC